VKPAAGRFILPSEAETPGEQPLLVLGYSYWQKRFGGDPRVIGKQVLVNGKPATILGIVSKEFHGMYSIFDMDAYLPLSAVSVVEGSNRFWSDRDLRRLLVFGRLKPGVNIPRAQSSIDVIAERLAEQYPATDKGTTVRVIPEKLSRPQPYANSFFILIAGWFLVLAGFVWLLACMNVENVFLARGSVRLREMGIRATLGAGRGRLIRQLLTEGVLLALLGGAGGAFLGMWAGRLISSIRVATLPLRLDCSVDWRVFTYALASAVFAGIMVGSWPALRASRADLNSVLHEGAQGDSGGAGHFRFRSVLVIAQVAGSLMLLIVAGLFVRSLERVERIDLGFDPGHLLNVTLDPNQIGYDQPGTNRFYRELEDRVRVLPGVQSASLASSVPMGNFPRKARVYIEGRPRAPGQPPPPVRFNSVDPSYFETLRVPLLRGRAFTESDNETAPGVAIINETMASRFWPKEDPIGKRLSIKDAAGPFMEVVGVAKDGKYQTVAEDSQLYFYVPLAQSNSSKRILQIRSVTPPESLIGPAKQVIRSLAPSLPIVDVQTMEQSLEGAYGFFLFRFGASLAAAMGVIGLMLAVVGVYGVVSFVASQRTHEIGIRMALGANPRDILNMVLRQGTRLVMAGVVMGMVAAWALARAMVHLLVGVSASDPVTYVSAAILLAAVALAACYIPARRATKVDPMVALRYE
jgi:putative ABC transport system permease protein